MHSKDIPIIPEEPPLYEGEFHEERGAMKALPRRARSVL